MKKLISILASVFLLSGCASFYEAEQKRMDEQAQIEAEKTKAIIAVVKSNNALAVAQAQVLTAVLTAQAKQNGFIMIPAGMGMPQPINPADIAKYYATISPTKSDPLTVGFTQIANTVIPLGASAITGYTAYKVAKTVNDCANTVTNIYDSYNSNSEESNNTENTTRNDVTASVDNSTYDQRVKLEYQDDNSSVDNSDNSVRENNSDNSNQDNSHENDNSEYENAVIPPVHVIPPVIYPPDPVAVNP